MQLSFRPQITVALAGVGALLAVLLVAFVAGAHTTPLSSTAGDTYVEAIVGAPRFVNPLLASSDTDTDLAHLVFSGLTRVDDRGDIVPDLASGWQTSPDGLVYTFTLKPDLRWHDGEALTSSDVLFTIGAVVANGFPGDPNLVAEWRNVRVETPSADSVRFTLPSANAAFLQQTTLGLIPQHLWADVKASDLAASNLNLSPVGSGPWRYVSTSGQQGGETGATPVPLVGPSDGVLLERNPYAYTPHPSTGISRIWMRLYPSFGAALAGFRAGEVHALGQIPQDQLAAVASVPGVTLHEQTLARYSMLILNVRSPLLDKVDTRQAIEYAIDKEAIVRNALGGYGKALYSPVLPHSWAFDPFISNRSYDPAQARRLLDSAGWAVGKDGVRARNGVTMTLVLSVNKDAPLSIAVAQQVQGYLTAVGIDVRLAAVSHDELLSDYLQPRAFHMAIVGWEASGADPDLYKYWHSSQAKPPDGLNFSGWRNPQADAALQKALQTTDKAALVKEYAAFQSAFASDVPAVILYSPYYVYATRSPASGVTLPDTDLLSPADRFDTIDGWSVVGSR